MVRLLLRLAFSTALVTALGCSDAGSENPREVPAPRCRAPVKLTPSRP